MGTGFGVLWLTLTLGATLKHFKFEEWQVLQLFGYLTATAAIGLFLTAEIEQHSRFVWVDGSLAVLWAMMAFV
jgi:hypothetical protein